MRTDEEIIARINAVKDRDWLGTRLSDLVVRLPYEKAKPWLRPDVTRKEWNDADRMRSREREAILKEIRDYMPFAWEKANNKRGISAGRSLEHFETWIWLAGDDLGDIFEDYEFYGKDILVRICEHYDIDHTQWDDGERVNE